MAKYVLIYHGGSMPEGEAERAAVMQAWGAWYASLAGGVVDGGNPFVPGGRGVASDGSVLDAPIGTMASGYTIIGAESLDAAVVAARHCPVLAGGGQVSVYETFDVM